ncbi:class I SAM-dependent methyltransferase [Chitinophaga nivalis]|uniref:S-adenosyl-L-methionine-dependent methyltransferase n=1 Tax=Chitinophaga nivalis TaxID=2991709 RepID=A0ABT3IRV0_9BACT|nr:SAM-dependent methyltransferase [Chitinophaga nivalis]MCW3463609.1 SAM-dependent methyltransferase [Chitinophaga nivalis]MCW3486701.1 SAM-dependent methyltransferase [Chitinophaga nivalis]
MSRSPTSKSGLYMAGFRALESCKPEGERLLYDPFATAFLSRFLQTIFAACTLPVARKLFSSYIQLRWPGVFTAAVARTKLIDDMIIHAVEKEGINQVIILSASYDTRAHRLKIGAPLHYVEVDHPEVQLNKRKILSELLEIPVIPVDYIPLNMGEEGMSEVIDQLLNRKHYKTLFLWEALTTWEEAREAEAIFRYISSFASGTQVIITYLDRAPLDNPKAYPGFSRIYRTLRRAGEKWDYGLRPKDIHQFMEAHHMQIRYDAGADQYRALYFGEESRHMKGYEYFRIVRGEVK